jgi:hypothetical protein
VRTKQPRVQPNASDPLGNEARKLTCGHAGFATTTTVEQKLARPFVVRRQIIIDRLSGLFAQFKSDRSPGLLLPHGCAIRRISTGGNILDSDGDDVAATKLAVDCQIEHRQIASATLDLAFRPDGPDVLGS